MKTITRLATLVLVCTAAACATEPRKPAAPPPPPVGDRGIKADIDTYKAAIKAADDAFDSARKTAIRAMMASLEAELEAPRDASADIFAAKWALAVKVAELAHDSDVIEAYCACLAARDAAQEVLDAAVDERNRTPDSARAYRATLNAARPPASDMATRAAEARIIAQSDRQADSLARWKAQAEK